MIRNGGGYPQPRNPLVRWLSHPVAWSIATVVAFLALFLAVFLEVQRHRLTDCLATYNDQTSAVTAARVAISDEDRRLDDVERDAQYRAEAALDAVLTATAGQDDAATREAFADLLRVRGEVAETRRQLAEQRAELERQRKAHPPPAPPQQQCR